MHAHFTLAVPGCGERLGNVGCVLIRDALPAEMDEVARLRVTA